MADKATVPTEESGVRIKLTVRERLIFQQLYPQQSNLINQTLVRDIGEKVSLNQQEQKLIGLKALDAGRIRWDEGADNKASKIVKFTGTEIEFLKSQVNRLDKEEKINQEILDLCLKIREAKEQQN